MLVVQVLDAVLDLAQKHIGLGQGLGGLRRHQFGRGQAWQCVQRGAAAQLGELSAAHHLEQLHGEFDFADAPARELDVVGPAWVARGAFGRVVANLVVQLTQGFKDVVVQVAPKHKGQNHAAQGARAAIPHRTQRRDHPALEPSKTLPFAPLHHKVGLQRGQRHRGRTGVAVGAQGQVDAKNQTVFRALTHSLVDVFDQLAEKFVVGDAQATLGIAGGLAVLVVDINQVNVARDVEFSRAQFAHAHDPALGHHIARHGRAVQLGEFGHGQLVGQVQGQLGQFGHGVRDVAQRRALLAVEHGQTLQDQVTQHPQGRRGGEAGGLQRRQAQEHLFFARYAGRQEGQHVGIASANARHKA